MKHNKMAVTFGLPATGVIGVPPATNADLTLPTNDGMNYVVQLQTDGWSPGVVSAAQDYRDEFGVVKSKITFRRSLVTHIQPGTATGFIYSGQIAPDAELTNALVADSEIPVLARVAFGLIHRECLDSQLPLMNGETWYQTSNLPPGRQPTRSVFTDIIDAETQLIVYNAGFVALGRGVCEIFRFQDRVRTSRAFQTGDSLLAIVDNSNAGRVGVRVTLAITYFYKLD
jgi:hypothetical protein